ncbi:MAG: Fur family transcriptional regulator [Alphaproteobacteria bacterium]|nr:Fur family transcriptional regulator [Alphaproteobacteria bacterium]
MNDRDTFQNQDRTERPFERALQMVRSAGLRPTRQRLALAKLLFEDGDRHVTAEQLHEEATGAGIAVSLATVYNTLHQFTQVGLLRQVVVDPVRSYFDTNTGDHHHYYLEEDGSLEDIAPQRVDVGALPPLPDGTEIERIDVIFRLRRRS